jgi:SNF family Na+-dependent transporter
MRSIANHLIVIMIMLAGCLSACDANHGYLTSTKRFLIQHGIKIPWLYSIFLLMIRLQNHNLLVQIRNETSYSFSNLWLFIEITQPDGEIS